jgi:hypothetical protein
MSIIVRAEYTVGVADFSPTFQSGGAAPKSSALCGAAMRRYRSNGGRPRCFHLCRSVWCDDASW